MKCILHIGCEKTGTTSIQSALSSHPESLRSSGIHAIQSGGFPNAVHLALASLDPSRGVPNYTRLGVADNALARRQWADRLWVSIAAEVAGIIDASPRGDRLLVSTEHFHSRSMSIREIEQLASRLSTIGVTEVAVIVYLRRQVDVAVSRFSTALKAGFSRTEVLPPLGRMDYFYDYFELLERWASVFGEKAMSVRCYELARADRHGVIGDFLSLLGVDPTMVLAADADRKLNAALSGNAQRVLMGVNEALEREGRSREEGARLRRTILSVLETDRQGARVLPGRDTAVAFQRQFDARNADVFARWFDGQRVFPDDFEAFPAESPDTTVSPELLLLARATSEFI